MPLSVSSAYNSAALTSLQRTPAASPEKDLLGASPTPSNEREDIISLSPEALEQMERDKKASSLLEKISLDRDGDGSITPYEIQQDYEEKLQRMEDKLQQYKADLGLLGQDVELSITSDNHGNIIVKGDEPAASQMQEKLDNDDDFRNDLIGAHNNATMMALIEAQEQAQARIENNEDEEEVHDWLIQRSEDIKAMNFTMDLSSSGLTAGLATAKPVLA